MSVHTATVSWSRMKEQKFTDGRYHRTHQWSFDGGACIDASPSPSIVPHPYSNADFVDPEEAFVVSLSSCHMLFFLQFAAQSGLVIDDYQDTAEGILEKDSSGNLVITKVILRPNVTVAGDVHEQKEKLAQLHHKAHDACFLARSVQCDVIVETP